MKTIINKTRKPLKISLGAGKTLFLGAMRQAAVRPAALEHPPLKKLIDAGEIEVADEKTKQAVGAASGGFSGKASQGYVSGRAKTQSGDR